MRVTSLTTVTVTVFHRLQPVFNTELDGPLEFGRQRVGEPEPYRRIRTAQCERVIIASLPESTVSREHLYVEPLPDGRIRVENRSRKGAIAIGAMQRLQAGESCDVDLPVLLSLGEKTVRLEATVPAYNDGDEPSSPAGMESLEIPTLAPGQQDLGQPTLLADLISSSQSPAGAERVVRWLQSTMSVFQSAASAPDFLPQSAQAVADIVGVDTAAVLRWNAGDWTIEATRAPRGKNVPKNWEPSRLILERVRRERRTFRFVPGFDLESAASLRDVKALVAAPILDARGNVIGALYGDRRRTAAGMMQGDISQLETMLVELLACGVAAGLARLEQERAAMAARVQFEQFFSPELASRLAAEPDLLNGRDAEVTVLFCDIRGFSRISEQLGPARTVGWISDVMGVLSECVIQESGVLVDYIGDELMAMWGAPGDQPDHAVRACNAAIRMLDSLPEMNERWQRIIGEPMDIGVGINSGVARVGNTGSHRKFKYGPLGNTVNLGSRVQGANKFVKTQALVTGETVARLGGSFHVRRVCRVRVMNIAEPVDLFELVGEVDSKWIQLKHQYEQALIAFERGDFLAATRLLGNLLEDHPTDGPILVLLSRTVNALAHPPESFDSVWKLSEK